MIHGGCRGFGTSPDTVQALPRPRWTSRSSTFTIHGGCGGVQGGSQRTLRASWEPKGVPKKAFWISGWRSGRPPMLCHRFKNIEEHSFLHCFQHHEVALGLAWVRFVGEKVPQRIHAFLRRLQRPLRGPHIIPSVPITSLEMPRECPGAPRDLQGTRSRHEEAPKPRPPYENTRKTNGFY